MGTVTEASGLVTGKMKHNVASLSLILISVLMFMTVAAFNALAGSGSAPDIFESTVGNNSDKFDLYITPAGLTFSIWGVIYFWLAASLLILVISIFLTNSGGRVYLSPPFATPLVSGITILNFSMNVAWIFIWDRQYVTLASVLLFLQVLTEVLVIGLMARSLVQYEEVYKRGGPMFVWGILYRIILNGWGMYTAWCVVASLINLSHALVYDGETDMKATCLAALSLLVVVHVTWFCLENFVLDRYFRWFLTPYLVIIWASNGIRVKIDERLAEDQEVPDEIKQYVLAILIIASITLAVRLIIVTYRTFRDRR